MEKIMFPMKNIWITQLWGKHSSVVSHKYNKAIDCQGKSNITIDNIIAPYTGTVVRTYPTENEVWFQSLYKVQFADGTIDYATMIFGHDSDISNLKVGKVITQGSVFLQEGKKYNNKFTADLHIHFEIQAGLTKEWIKAPDGGWNLPNGKEPDKCFFVDHTYNIIQTLGLKFKTTAIGTPVARNTQVDQIEVNIDNLRCRNAPNGIVLGYIQKGIYNILSKELEGNYTWYEVEEDKWIAYDKSWAIIYLKQESELELLKKENAVLKAQNATLTKDNQLLKDRLKQINKISTI